VGYADSFRFWLPIRKPVDATGNRLCFTGLPRGASAGTALNKWVNAMSRSHRSSVMVREPARQDSGARCRDL
jgi:hypothetical protein